MDVSIWIVTLMTFVIHYIGTLAMAVRIVGIQTKLWSMSYAIFNIISIFSRMSNTLQAPLLAKIVETDIQQGREANDLSFRIIILSASIGTIVGGFSIPTFQRVLARMVRKYYEVHSFTRLFFYVFKPRAWRYVYQCLKWPEYGNWLFLKNTDGISLKILILNMLSSAILTIGVLSCLYAGYLNPDLRATSGSMNGIINGVSTLLALVLVDPYIALLTDEVNVGKRPESDYRRYIVFLLVARLAGTLIAQFMLVPLSYFVLFLAEHIRL
jgi:Alternate to MurJ